jgi:hypothetical protein
VVPVRLHRGRTQATLGDQVLEEPGQDPRKGQAAPPPPSPLEPGQHDSQHLLDRAADLLGQGRAHHAVAARPGAPGDPLGYERLDMPGEVLHRFGAPGTGELAEGDKHRHPARHIPSSIPVPGQPVDIALDLRADPRRPDPIHSLGLDEVVLQHGQLPLCEYLDE